MRCKIVAWYSTIKSSDAVSGLPTLLKTQSKGRPKGKTPATLKSLNCLSQAFLREISNSAQVYER